MYVKFLDSPPIYQWDRYGNSEVNRSNNCAVASCANILNYYNDAAPPGYSQDTLRRAAWIPDGTPTAPSQQQRMLAYGGVEAIISSPSLAALKALIAGGNRPVLAGLYFGRVPDDIADHVFNGMHAITMFANETRVYQGSWRSGMAFRDGNFSSWTNRPDPDRGHRWMPDTVFDYAFVTDPSGGRRGFALIPSNVKVVQQFTYAVIAKNAKVYSGTVLDAAHVVARDYTQQIELRYLGTIHSDDSGEYVKPGGGTSKLWAKVQAGTTTRYIPYYRVLRFVTH